MDKDNIYSAPTADLALEEKKLTLINASRGSRLGAAVIDLIIQAVIFAGIIFIIAEFTTIDDGYINFIFNSLENLLEEVNLNEYLLALSFIGIYILFFLIINGYLLVTQGQTIGKKIVGIHIVNENGQIPDVFHVIGLRFVLISLFGLIPFLGEYFGLIDVIFIFGMEKRCIHDYIAGTRVIDRKANEFETDYSTNNLNKDSIVVDDEEINSSGINYSEYNQLELRDILSRIDGEQHPERVRLIKLALKRFE